MRVPARFAIAATIAIVVLTILACSSDDAGSGDESTNSETATSAAPTGASSREPTVTKDSAFGGSRQANSDDVKPGSRDTSEPTTQQQPLQPGMQPPPGGQLPQGVPPLRPGMQPPPDGQLPQGVPPLPASGAIAPSTDSSPPKPIPDDSPPMIGSSDNSNSAGTSVPSLPSPGDRAGETAEPVKTEPTEDVQTSSESAPVELQPGQIYQGGTRLSIPAIGVSFTIPENWTGTQPQGSDFIAMKAESGRGLAVAMGQASTRVEEVMAGMSQPLPIDQTLVLYPVTQPQVDGVWVANWYSGTNGMTMTTGYSLALVDPNGQGILYLATGPQNTADAVEAIAVQLALSTEVSAAVAAVADSGAGAATTGGLSAAAQEWQEYLAGQLLTYMSTYDSDGAGSSMKRLMNLCSDGRFYYSDESLVSVDVPGVSGFDPGQTEDQGQWRILTQGDLVGIEFRWSSGETSSHQLDYVNEETQIDGQRWFVTDDNQYCN